MDEYLKIRAAVQRLFFFLLIFILASHITTCLWLIIATQMSSSKDYKGTWIGTFHFENDDYAALYCVAFYWTITTITTVGYGDIEGTNDLERIFCSIIMIIGVILFSLANGALASIVENGGENDSGEKLEVINQAHKNFRLSQKFYVQIQKMIKHEARESHQDIAELLDILPQHQKIRMSIYVYEERYSMLNVFRNKSL